MEEKGKQMKRKSENRGILIFLPNRNKMRRSEEVKEEGEKKKRRKEEKGKKYKK